MTTIDDQGGDASIFGKIASSIKAVVRPEPKGKDAAYTTDEDLEQQQKEYEKRQAEWLNIHNDFLFHP